MFSHLFGNSSVHDLLAFLQSTVQTVLEILIGWFEEHDFVPHLVSSSLIYSVALTPSPHPLLLQVQLTPSCSI